MRLTTGWLLTSTAPGEPPAADAIWHPATVPGTVAQAIDAPLDGTDLEAFDWWYRCHLAVEPALYGRRLRLGFQGLATLCEVWLDGVSLLTSANMFVPRAVEITLGEGGGELRIVFRSLRPELAKKRPRPRWKTALVDHQNLRWVRTSLVGRIPGWTPRLPAIGPWREITLEGTPAVEVRDLRLHARVKGADGHLRVEAKVHRAPDPAIHRPDDLLDLHIDGRAIPLVLGPDSEMSADVVIPGVKPWWPHTHGDPNRVPWALTLTVDGETTQVAAGKIGFRTVTFEEGQLRVNDRPVFCRGAVWTVQDVRTLDGTPEALRQTLTLARAGGLNMLRIGGTMTYGTDLFYDLCTELGILVWQDLLLANMDYPFVDPAFAENIDVEVQSMLSTTHRHACLAVYCGGSEIQQQAAMIGLPASEWSGPFFDVRLPELLAEGHPGVPYVPSTPCGGDLPFHTSTGIAHYYGVGAYWRPLADVRLAGVKFTSECLGFANVPEPSGMPTLPSGALAPPHHPVWKAGVPRDNGAGWDFEDIRDHYLRELFGLDPITLRSVDLERYHAISRVVTGELMFRTFAMWRRPGSGCGGALVWFFKDLRPGAGWGILDSTGRPKAAWWYLRRAWARQAIFLTDEGLNGLNVHVVNEGREDLDATVEIELLNGARRRVEHTTTTVNVRALSAWTGSVDALLGHFTDVNHAYRFGPPRHDVAIARLVKGDEVLHQDVMFPGGHTLGTQDIDQLEGTVARVEGAVEVTLQSRCLCQALSFAAPGFQPSDNHLHLAPGRPLTVRFVPEGEDRPFKVHISALNLDGMLTLRG